MTFLTSPGGDIIIESRHDGKIDRRAKSILKTPAAFSTIEENLTVIITSSVIWEMSDSRRSRTYRRSEVHAGILHGLSALQANVGNP